MGYAKYVGRVGALAVALGVGVAVANGPGTAVAQTGDTGSGDSGSSTSTSNDTTSTGGTTTGSTTTGTTTTTGTDSTGAAGDQSTIETTTTESTPSNGSNTTPTTEPTQPGPGEATDNVGPTTTPDTSTEGESDHGSSSTAETVEYPAPESAGPQPDTGSATARENVYNPPSGDVGTGDGMRVAAQTTVSEPENVGLTSTALTTAPELDEQPSIDMTATPTGDVGLEPSSDDEIGEQDTPIFTRVLEMLSLDPAAGGAPSTPTESPLLLAMLGWARKESEKLAEDEQDQQQLPSLMAMTTSQTVDEDAPMAFASLVASETTPEIVEATVGAPDPVTGVVVVTVVADDQDGDELTYSLQGAQPPGGSVTVNQNGTFTYTPTAAARFAAARTVGAETNSFTVAVSDGQSTITRTVTVTLSPADLTLADPLAGLGNTPAGVAIVGNQAYVANQGSSSVVVYDMSGPIAQLVKTITVGSAPTAVVASPDRTKVYVTNQYSHTVSVISTSTNTVTATIAVGYYPLAATVSPDGSRLYVANMYGQSLSVVNTTTNAVVATVALASYPNSVAISPDGTKVYVTNQYANSVSIINTATNTVAASVNVGATPSSVAVHTSRAVVTNQGGNSVSIINTATGAVIGTVSLPAGGAPTSVVIGKDGTVAYVASNNDTISVIDLTAPVPAVVRTLVADSVPEAGIQTLVLSADGNRLYVVDATSRVLRAISISSKVLPATITTGVNASTTSIAGGVEAANLGAPEGKISLIGTDADDLVQYQPGYWNPNWKTAQNGTVGVATNATSSWGIDMDVTGTRFVEFNVYAQGFPYVQIFVDDQKLSDPFQPTWNAYGQNTLKLDFGEGNSGPHNVRVMLGGIAGQYGVAVGKVWTEAGGAVSAPPPTGPRLFILGDSTSAGSQNETGYELGTWIPRFAEMAGISDFWNGAIVATSYEPSLFGFANFKTRAGTEVVPSAADVVIVATPNIDIFNGYKPADIATNVSNVVTTLSSMPNSPRIIIIGAFDATGVNGPVYTNVDAAIMPAIAGRAAYVSTVGGPLIGYDGETLLASSTPWVTAENRQYILGGDGLHPNDAGQAGLAGKIFDAYTALEAADGNRAPVAGTPSAPTVNQATGVVTGSLNFTDPDGNTLTYTVPSQPSAGTVTVSPTGVYTFTPTQAARDGAAAGTGPSTASFTVTASDGEFSTSSAPITVTIVPSNRAPVAGSPSAPTVNQGTGVVTGSLNFTDPDGNTLTYTVPSQPSAGTVTVSPTGVYTFTPTQAARDGAAAGTGPTTASFTVTASDGQYSTSSAPITVTIVPTSAANQAPVVTGKTVNVPNQSTGVVTGAVTATDANGDALTYSLSGGQPAAGTVTVNADGTFTFTPTQAARLAAGQSSGADYAGFTVAVSDGQNSTTTTVSVAVLPANLTLSSTSAPTGATPQGAVVVGNHAYVANQGAHTVSVINTTTNTVVKTIAVGYAPTGMAASPDNTRVYVTNGWSNTVSVIDTATNTVSATIGVGQGPVAAAVSPDGTRLYVTNLIGNSVSVINTTTRTVIATVAVGAYPNGVAVSPDGTRAYITNQYSNAVSVINTATNTVITTVAVGTNPSAVAVSATRAVVTNQGANSVSVLNTTTATPTVIATIALGAGTAPTSVVLSKDGTLAYVANTNDTVSIIDMTATTPTLLRTVAADTTPETGHHILTLSPEGTRLYVVDTADNALRSLTLTRGNTAPVAGTPSQTSLNTDTGVVTGRLNVTDPDGDSLTYTVTPSPSGSITVSPTGVYTFTPTQAARDAAAAGTGPTSVSFTVTASDGTATPVSVPVSAPITASQPVANRAPVAGTPSAPTVNQATGVVTGSLNFTDPDGNTLTYTVPSQPSAGTVTVSPTGVYTFTPTQAARDGAAAGTGPSTASFTVTASDGEFSTSSAPITVTIVPSNRAPVAGSPSAPTVNQGTGVVTGSLNFTDPDGNTLTYTVPSQPSAGTVTVSPTGVYTFTPTQAARDGAAAGTGPTTASFTVTASDGQFSTSSAPITVTIVPTSAANQAPVVTGKTVNVPNQSTGVVTGAVTATDANGDALTYSLSGGQPAAGTVTVNADGTFTFTPTQAARLAAGQSSGADYAGFTVAVSDGQNSTTTTVSVAVLPANLTLSSTSAPTGATPQGAVVVGNHAYVANQGAHTVSVINTTTNTVVKTIAVGYAPTGMAASPDNTRVYVTNGWSNTVSVIDTATNTVSATIGVGQGPVAAAVSPDGTRLYVTNLIGNSVSVINTTTRTVIATVAVGAYPNRVAVSPDGTRAYITNQYSNAVSVINTATNTVITTVAVGTNPSAVAVSATRAVVTNQGANSVSVLNTTTATPTVIATIALGAGTAPTSVVLSKDGTLAYVANTNDTVSIIDMTATTPTLLRTVAADTTPETGHHILTLSPEGTRLYVVDTADNALRSLTLTRGNTAPVAGTPSQTSLNTDTGVVTGRLNVTDPDGDSLTYTVTPSPSGSITVSPTGVYTFTPTQAARDAAAAGTGPTSVSFTVTASDGTATPVSVPVSAPITASQPVANRAPVAGTPSAPTVNQATGVVTGSLNFTDPDGNTLTYTVPSQPSAGTVTVSPTGVYTFTPTQAARDGAAAGTGPTTASFTVTASDGEFSTSSAPITVTIVPTSAANQAPVAGTPSVTTQDPTTGVVAGQLNFTDPNNDPLTYTVVTQSSAGTVTVNADGTYTFTASNAARLAAGQSSGADYASFTVAVSDGQNSTTTTVSVAVLPANLTLSGTSAPTGTTPQGAVVVGNRAYVANQGAHTVSVIDITTNTVVKTIAVGYAPTGMAASPDNTRVYVTNGWSNTVSVIDTATNTVSGTIGVGQGPVAAAVSPDGTRLYVTNLIGNSVSVINTTTRTVIATVAVGAYPNGVAVSPDGTRAYITNQYSNAVSVINTATNTVITTVAVGTNPSAVAVSATRALVTNQGANSVSVLNTTTATPTVIATIALGANTAPTSVVLSKDGTLAYIANTNDTVSIIDMTTTTPTLLRTVAADTTPETGHHILTLSPEGTRLYVVDTADNALRSLSLGPAVGGLTIAHAPLMIPDSNGHTVDATWYFPNQEQAPVGVIYLQHGYTRSSANVAALAADLAERTNSIVVTPNVSSSYGHAYNIYDEPIERAVAKMFQGDRAELTASASAAAGRQITLPQQFALAGHSAGGNLVAASAGYLADAGAVTNLRAVILFDSVNDGDAVAGITKLTGANSVPVMLIAAEDCNCNNFGDHTETIVNNAPPQFIGVMLDGGSHLDVEGNTTDQHVVDFCGIPVAPHNAAAVQTITAAWINDVFTGSNSGIYGPDGAVISIGGATVEVIGVGDQPIVQTDSNAPNNSFA
ncbi:Ig-like domain-containing protein [Mycobacterium sp. IDR2000157661]|uniref:Ig-like domain-containing protein n=1 Tax=Mycobacterium sp. IDR2000157661 TaxID=2867005 RepID=UPI002102EFF1|nr:Ig-like domain-containing protein [Mycobacterium sp. IDR2000157661]ULE33593.1 tandem-95 repeat protein [Mycobacterium sp. IDR2000157661]